MEVLDSNSILTKVSELRNAGQHEQSLRVCSTALEQHPKSPHFKFAAAATFIDMGLNAYAISLLESAARDDKENFRILMNLASCYRRVYRIEEAVRTSKKAIACLKKEFPDWQQNEQTTLTMGMIYSNLAACYVNEGVPEAGEKYARKAVEYGTGNIAKWNLGLILRERGKWAEGFDLYRKGKGTNKRVPRNYNEVIRDGAPILDKDPTPILEKLSDIKEGQKVVVYGEQGIGDEIMFATCLQEFIDDCRARGADVILECQNKLESLFKMAFPGLEIHGTRNEDVLSWPLERRIDWAIPIGDLPYFYRQYDKDFFAASTEGRSAYLRVNQENVESLRETITKGDRKPVIGIAWSGGLLKTAVAYRSLRLEQLVPILELDAHFVSLQYTQADGEIDDLKRRYQGRVGDIKQFKYMTSHQLPDYMPMAELVAACDIVVSVCQSVVHLSGALGLSTIVLVPHKCAWRYCPKTMNRQIWYRDNMLIRQDGDLSWASEIRRVRDVLTFQFPDLKGNDQ